MEEATNFSEKVNEFLHASTIEEKRASLNSLILAIEDEELFRKIEAAVYQGLAEQKKYDDTGK